MQSFGRNRCGPKTGGMCPFGGGGAGSLSNTMLPGSRPTYLHAKFYLDPSNRLATVHQRHRQTGRDRQTHRQTGQRSYSIGRTVLQTVAQKPLICHNAATVRRIAMKFGLMTHFHHLKPSNRQNFEFLENPRWRTAAILKTVK